VSSQRPDGARDLVRRLAEGALAHDHEHVAPLQRLEQPAEPLLPRRRALRSGVGLRLPPAPVALKLLEALGASDRVVAGSCATLATVGAAAGVDPSGVESVVNSPMSAPPDRIPFSRVERRARRSTGSQRQAVAAVVNYGGAAAVDTVFIDRVKKRGELVGVDYAQLAREGEASHTYLLERFGVTTDEMRAGL
jgi:hypothetical protein